MPKWVRAITIVLICLVVISAILVVIAAKLHDLDESVRLPLLALIGVIALIAILSCVAVSFSAVDLSDRSQALGLPNGSIRAVIAMTLILLFGIVVIYLYGNLASTDATQAGDFAKQLLVMTGTLITSVASFYFGTQAAANAQADKSAPPNLTGVSPTTRAQGTSGQISADGTNLQLAQTLKLVKGTAEIVVASVVSDATSVSGKLDIPGDADTGPWDMVTETSDKKTARLPAAFTITAAQSATPTLSPSNPALTAEQGATSDVSLQGTNLQLVTDLQLVSGSTAITATGVTSNATIIKATVAIPADAAPGQWDIVATTSDRQTTTLPKGFEIKTKS